MQHTLALLTALLLASLADLGAAEPRPNILAQHADIASRLTKRITAIVQKGRTTPGADQANDTGWWDDLAWIPGKGSSPKIKKKGNKRAAADPVAP